MKTLVKRLARLEERLTPVHPDYLRNPRIRHRLVVRRLGSASGLETATCRRTLSADGALFEMVKLDGSRFDLADGQLEQFVESFPIEAV
jgi:hypothetical protein